jgi:hypothetical protein
MGIDGHLKCRIAEAILLDIEGDVLLRWRRLGRLNTWRGKTFRPCMATASLATCFHLKSGVKNEIKRLQRHHGHRQQDRCRKQK